MSDHLDRAAEVVEHVLSRHGEHGTYLDAARALAAAGLLATEHDADENPDDRYDQEHENAVLLDAEIEADHE